MLKMVERHQRRKSDWLFVKKGVDVETQTFYGNASGAIAEYGRQINENPCLDNIVVYSSN